MKYTGLVFVVLAMSVLLFSSRVSAEDWRAFTPRVYGMGADIELQTQYESEDVKVGPNETKWTDMFARERLTYYSDGFIYHPKFISLHLLLSENVKERDHSYSSGNSRRSNSTGFGYAFRMEVLPEHPYHASFWTTRNEDIGSGQATSIDVVSSSTGGLLEYKKKPYVVTLRYSDDTTSSSDMSSDVQVASVQGGYFKEYRSGRKLDVSTYYQHKDFTTSTLGGGFGGSSNDFNLGASVYARELTVLKDVSLSSYFSKSVLNQDTISAGSLTNDHLSWYEQFNASLPLNFDTTASYRYDKNSDTGSAAGGDLSQTEKDYNFSLTHHLYRSLTTSYSFADQTVSSPSGDANNVTHTFTSTYAKRIPRGLLVMSGSVSRSVSDNAGGITIVNEPHPPQLLGDYFDLTTTQQVDPSTIRVYVKALLPPNLPVLLKEEDGDYILTPMGNTFRITPLNVPFAYPPGTLFEFSVTYSLVAEDSRIQTTDYNYNLSLNLFDGLLMPYYAYTSLKSEVLSGTLLGGPLESTSNVVGLNINKPPFSFMGSYTRVESNVNPYWQYRGELGYFQNIGETTRLVAHASYRNTNYQQGSADLPQTAYTEKAAAISANIIKRFPEKGLSLSAGGSYSMTRGLVTIRSFAANSALSWKIGKLALSLGGSMFSSRSEGTSQLTTERTHQYYYLKINRILF